jgi:DNA-binding CsgD family transcriptional regulator
MQKKPESELSIFPSRRLSRRQRQTLDLLLQGDSEKQIARQLKLSQNTVHFYIRWIYVAYGVNSRYELMAKFIPPHLRAAVVAPV